MSVTGVERTGRAQGYTNSKEQHKQGHRKQARRWLSGIPLIGQRQDREAEDCSGEELCEESGDRRHVRHLSEYEWSISFEKVTKQG